MALWIWLIILCVMYVVWKNVKMRWYFIKRGVPQYPKLPYLGAFGSNFISRRHINCTVKDLYNMNKEAKYVVSYTFFSHKIVVRDLDLIKSVLVKNFDHFAHRRTFVKEAIDPLTGKNLAFLNGDKWRDVRSLLSPAFTSSKMRTMHVLMSQCTEKFAETFIKLFANVDAIDIKDVFSRFTTDVIATCAFGIEVNSLDNPNDEFYVTGKKCSFTNGKIMLKFFFQAIFPKLASKLGTRIIPKEETDFFINIIKTTIKTRQEKGITRPDMLQLLIDAKSKVGEVSSEDLIEITAQAFIFFLGGFDTTSDFMCLMAHELAVNPDAQQKLQSEIDKVMRECDGKPTYEAIGNMNYLDAVFYETMRMHPIAFVSRVCSKDFEFPPALPGAKPITIKSGTEVFAAVAAIHRDPVYYENPDKFDPDRYSNKKISGDVVNLGFGLGPRMCIGNRFAILEIKTLFIQLLSKCSLEPCKKTCIPFKHDSSKFAVYPKGGFWLQMKSRS
ncbi:cytochrome P450 9e2-like [Copidosoma floridanum]|uniref:cytochrome P450 9e2-like n=1 Tax=Copidosoma floridanum TaxID=29053 RepID=UPI0006C9B03F|nr:cytochrome P450 9e2-like [Copidosoma floridanum]